MKIDGPGNGDKAPADDLLVWLKGDEVQVGGKRKQINAMIRLCVEMRSDDVFGKAVFARPTSSVTCLSSALSLSASQPGALACNEAMS